MLHIAAPVPPSIRSPAGSRISTWKQRELLLVVLGSSVRGKRSPSLISFLPRIPHARVSYEKMGLCTKALKKQTNCQTPHGVCEQPKNDEGNLSFRCNPPTPPFNSSLLLFSYPCSTSNLEARTTCRQRGQTSQEISGKTILLREPEQNSSGENRYTNKRK
jgi:hypothetical protein